MTRESPLASPGNRRTSTDADSMSASESPPRCTIIVPTLALRERASSLERAIRSIHAGSSKRSRILVVVNGNRFDPALLSTLRQRSDIDVMYVEMGSSPAAILAGRRQVETEFFGFLDDDDEYLPGAVDLRLRLLSEHPEASIAVTNGYRRKDGVDHRNLDDLVNVPSDPLAALLRQNWLTSCGALYRSADVPSGYFEDSPRHIHWTWLAFRLVEAGKRVVVADELAYRIHDTEGSASKSSTYLMTQVEVYNRMLAMSSRPDISRTLRRRLAAAWHQVSNHHLREGAVGKAWRAHLQSLRYPSGLRYLTYSRKLVVTKRYA